MDIGVISVRYARALLKGSTEQHIEEQVYNEMQTLAESYIKVPELRRTVDNPMIAKEVKAKLLKSAAGSSSVTSMTERLIDLILKEGRENMTQFIANAYVTLYRQQKNITRGKLITAVPVTDSVQQKMLSMVKGRTNGHVEFTTETDPTILGGFILEYDTYRLDTSVKTQLNNIQKKLS